jgi:hypothetical protein
MVLVVGCRYDCRVCGTGGAAMNEEEGGYSGLFYMMLALGIVGLLGFLAVAAGVAGGL